MSDTVLERAREPFFTTKEFSEGNGLGLSMVDGFVRQSGGHMAMSSQTGRGTVVKLFLPRLHNEVQPPMTSGFQTTQAVCGKREVVLLVEDDGGIRRTARRLLEALGYEVFDAEDGPSALLLLAESPPVDLLLSDFTLPNGMSGLEVAGAVRNRFPKVRVLYMSGYRKDVNSSANPHRDIIHLLPKPFKTDELVRAIRQVMDSPETVLQATLGGRTEATPPMRH